MYLHLCFAYKRKKTAIKIALNAMATRSALGWLGSGYGLCVCYGGTVFFSWSSFGALCTEQLCKCVSSDLEVVTSADRFEDSACVAAWNTQLLPENKPSFVPPELPSCCLPLCVIWLTIVRFHWHIQLTAWGNDVIAIILYMEHYGDHDNRNAPGVSYHCNCNLIGMAPVRLWVTRIHEVKRHSNFLKLLTKSIGACYTLVWLTYFCGKTAVMTGVQLIQRCDF